MPYLREAVEKKRQFYISYLIKLGIYGNADQKIKSMTLTELQNIYRHYVAHHHKKENL